MTLPSTSSKPGAAAPQPTNYAYGGAYDRAKFNAGIQKQFVDGFSASTTVADFDEFLTLIENDKDMADVRWSAYLLATVYHETGSTVTEQRIKLDRKGRPLLDPKLHTPVMRDVQKNSHMHPISEKGLGIHKRYFEPVKVTLSADGNYLVTEHDGDEFSVDPLGNWRAIGKAKAGAPYQGKAAPSYTGVKADENCYYGRGFVQLTWWYNYIAAGKAIGIGTQLLTDPQKANDPATAYKIAALGMRTGKLFGNGTKFSDYFSAAKTDYVGARYMVNGNDDDEAIAAIARKFEAILLSSRIVAPVAVPRAAPGAAPGAPPPVRVPLG